MTPLIQLQSVTVTYGGRTILDRLDFRLDPADRVGIVGPIGAGKTSLLRLMVGLLKPASGTVRVFGDPCRREADSRPVRRRVGIVFQDADDQLFSPTVLEDVAFGPLNLGRTPADADAAAHNALALVGLPGIGDRITYGLSGGEKRLVALACVLAMGPDVLLLDEPTSSLDPASVARLTNVLKALPQALVVVSHSTDFLDSVVDRTLRLEQGTLHGPGRPAGHR